MTLERARTPSGLLQRIVRLEEQVRQLRLRHPADGPAEDWQSLTPYLNTSQFTAETGSLFPTPGFYVDRDRVYLRGMVYTQVDNADQILDGFPAQYCPGALAFEWVPHYQSTAHKFTGWVAFMYPSGAFGTSNFFVQGLPDPNTPPDASWKSLPQTGDDLVLDGVSWRIT